MSKYCVLPGQTPVRLDSLDGHIIIIGETPREIPEMFVLRARAAGCLTEEELAALALRLAAGAPAGNPALLNGTGGTSSSSASGADIPLPGQTGDSGPVVGDSASIGGDDDRSAQITAAVIELLNIGNPADFTGAGAPKVEALKDKLGFEVTTAERDAAYKTAKG